MTHKRHIKLGAILGAGLLGSLFALGSDSIPRPKPIAPPPAEGDPQIPVAQPNATTPSDLPKLPGVPDPNDLSTIPTVKPELTPKRGSGPIADLTPEENQLLNQRGGAGNLQQIQHVEPKSLPNLTTPSLPPPLPPVSPAQMGGSELPPPPKLVDVPMPNVEVKPESKKPVERDPFLDLVKPPSPTDPAFPGNNDIAPIPPPVAPLAKPPVENPAPAPIDAPPPSRFVVPKTPQGSPPPMIEQTPPPQQPAPQPLQQKSPPPVDAPPHNIPYFTPVNKRPQPQVQPQVRVPIHEASRPSGSPRGSELLHAPAQDPALGTVTPQLTHEKRGPLFHKVGGPLKYQITVRNVGTITANQVRIEDEVPGTQLVAAQPPTTTTQGDRLVWILPSLRPGEERTFIEELQPIRAGDVVSATSVHVYASTSFRTKLDGEVTPPPLGGNGGPLLSPFGPGQTSPPGPSLDSNPPLGGPSLGGTPSNSAPVASTQNPQSLTAAQIPMTVEVKALPIVGVGQKLVFEVIVKNIGSAPLTGLALYGRVPSGFHHPEGPNIGADLPDMKVGETKSFKMPMTAIAPGKHVVEIRVTAKPYYELVARPVVTVEGKGISIQQQSSSPRLQTGKDNEIKITIANDQPTPVSQVHVVDVLPEGLDFVGASDRGMYQASSRTITWLLDVVPPGETRTVSLKVQPKSAGTFNHEVVARGHDVPESKSATTYHAESFSNVRLEVHCRDGANVELGKETVYAIRLTNVGTSAATNVQASVSLSPGLEASGFAQAPTGYRINGRDVVFAPLPRLPAGETRTIHLGVRAAAQGPQSVRVQVVADQLRTPTTREERTLVYREK